jgi:hypothetical protein
MLSRRHSSSFQLSSERLTSKQLVQHVHGCLQRTARQQGETGDTGCHIMAAAGVGLSDIGQVPSSSVAVLALHTLLLVTTTAGLCVGRCNAAHNRDTWQARQPRNHLAPELWCAAAYVYVAGRQLSQLAL